jgi:molybdate-binding protein/DNA-binding transcriptional regulator YhcF (GntR family)
MQRKSMQQEIVDAVRRDMLRGVLRPGDSLPTVREMAERWSCSPGTAQQAYHELARQGLIICRVGRGTFVGPDISAAATGDNTLLRQAGLVHRTDAYLLDVFGSGYTPEEVEFAMHTALDRWRVTLGEPNVAPERILRFRGSHDPALSMIATRFGEIDVKAALLTQFVGSLGGLIALAEGQADIAGCHLWDPETQSYNVPYIERLLPGRKIALIRLADRQLGLVTAPGNPKRIRRLGDLAQPGVRYVNRRPGTGTRVWLDTQLAKLDIRAGEIPGYTTEVLTHGDVAQAVAEGEADVGLAIGAVASNYGLEFVPLQWEPYDLVVTSDVWDEPAVQGLVRWLKLPSSRAMFAVMGGYSTTNSGHVNKIRT